MYYEYHLEDGTIYNSELGFLNHVELRRGEEYYCEECRECHEVYTWLNVKYAIIKEGEIPSDDEGDNDWWIEQVELGD